MKKKRLDEILIERQIVKDKGEAFIFVTGGNVFVEGQKAVSPAQMYVADIQIRVREIPKYVGRAGLKLEAAFDTFSLSADGKICADIGSATGGFTDLLLQRGAKKVYAIDAGKGKLALKLREDSRVVVMEEVNILYLESLSELVDLVTVDLSFTSLRLALTKLIKFLKPESEVVALFKPQYEVEEHQLVHGIVEDETIRKNALESFTEWAKENGWSVVQSIESPIRGVKGNTEYLLYLQFTSIPID